MWVTLKRACFWCWDKDTDLEMDLYCRCSKWPSLAATQAVKASSSSKTAPSSHVVAGFKRTILGSLRRITFEPNSVTGLTHLGHHAGKVPWTPAEAQDDWSVETRFANHLGRVRIRTMFSNLQMIPTFLGKKIALRIEIFSSAIYNNFWIGQRHGSYRSISKCQVFCISVDIPRIFYII